MRAIVYSLFGYGVKKEANSFPFETYLRGLAINIMLNRLLYPGWDNVVVMDRQTYAHCGTLVKRLGAKVEAQDAQPFCKMMLWRLRPAFYTNNEGAWKYEHIICRDTDSPPTYREAQAVQHWINEGTTAHAITDSISHGIPMLGGMVGFVPAGLSMRLGVNSWEELMTLNTMDLGRKGSDQDFLNQVIYPELSKYGQCSVTQHYFKGMPETNMPYYHKCLCDPVAGHRADCHLNIEVQDVDPELACTNSVAGHVGAAGFYEPPMMAILEKYKDRFTDMLEAQKEYPQLFYWVK